MRLQRYMTEMFAGADMIGSDLLEIFKNPDNKELKDLKDKSKFGFRVIVDIEKKHIYISSAELIHQDIIKSIKPPISGLSYNRFSNTGQGMDKYLMFSTDEPNFNKITSDVYSFMSRGGLYDTDELKSIIEKLKGAKDSDYGWISKWMAPGQVTKMLDNAIDRIQERLDKRLK